jgi:hypothetical protein
MTNYASMMKRIRAAATLEDIRKIETSMARLYEAGIFTDEEFYGLDDKVLDCFTRIESEVLTQEDESAIAFDEWMEDRAEQYLEDSYKHFFSLAERGGNK